MWLAAGVHPWPVWPRREKVPAEMQITGFFFLKEHIKGVKKEEGKKKTGTVVTR